MSSKSHASLEIKTDITPADVEDAQQSLLGNLENPYMET